MLHLTSKLVSTSVAGNTLNKAVKTWANVIGAALSATFKAVFGTPSSPGDLFSVSFFDASRTFSSSTFGISAGFTCAAGNFVYFCWDESVHCILQ